MSVFIKNMRIPTSCSVCAFCGYYGKGDHVCDITGKEVVYELSLEKRLDDCPIVELPLHGRLIDADALLASSLGGEPFKSVIRRVLLQAPTIIEAEGK